MDLITLGALREWDTNVARSNSTSAYAARVLKSWKGEVMLKLIIFHVHCIAISLL